MITTSYYYKEGGGVTFRGNGKELHSYKDFGLVLREVEITIPEPQTNFVEIPFRDGSLDLSEPYGEENINYKDRFIYLTFTDTEFRENFLLEFSELAQFLLGKHREIILDKDPTYYYIGRCTNFSEIEKEADFGTLVLTFQVEPYRYANVSSSHPWLWDPFNFIYDMAIDSGDFTVDGTLTRIIYTGENDETPTITVDTDMTLEFEGKTYQLKAGTTKNYDIRLRGNVENVLVFHGHGTVTIDYKGGRF